MRRRTLEIALGALVIGALLAWLGWNVWRWWRQRRGRGQTRALNQFSSTYENPGPSQSPSPSPSSDPTVVTYQEIVSDTYLYPMSTSAGIRTWPELVGLDAHEAKRILESRTPHRIELVRAPDAAAPHTVDIDRIRLIHDPNSMRVTETPRVG